MARGVRQGCPACGFLFLEFLQPTQCADADDLAVASSSFRGLMYALAPAFRSVDCQDNTSKDPFSQCEICKNLGYRLRTKSDYNINK